MNCAARGNSLAVTLVCWLHGCDAGSRRLAVKERYIPSQAPPGTAAESKAI